MRHHLKTALHLLRLKNGIDVGADDGESRVPRHTPPVKGRWARRVRSEWVTAPHAGAACDVVGVGVADGDVGANVELQDDVVVEDKAHSA